MSLVYVFCTTAGCGGQIAFDRQGKEHPRSGVRLLHRDREVVGESRIAEAGDVGTALYACPRHRTTRRGTRAPRNAQELGEATAQLRFARACQRAVEDSGRAAGGGS